MVKTASKSEFTKNDDSKMLDFNEEKVRETQRSFRPIRSTTTSVNMVYIVEFPKEDALKQYEALATSGTPIFLLEAPLLKESLFKFNYKGNCRVMVESSLCLGRNGLRC